MKEMSSVGPFFRSLALWHFWVDSKGAQKVPKKVPRKCQRIYSSVYAFGTSSNNADTMGPALLILGRCGHVLSWRVRRALSDPSVWSPLAGKKTRQIPLRTARFTATCQIGGLVSRSRVSQISRGPCPIPGSSCSLLGRADDAPTDTPGRGRAALHRANRLCFGQAAK